MAFQLLIRVGVKRVSIAALFVHLVLTDRLEHKQVVLH